MIRLFTGLPGSFKTCHAVRVIREAVAAGRPVFVSNLEGLNVPGVEVWDDPKQWEALPVGALLVVDEAQRYWRASRDLNIPPEIVALETHRHKGIDFLLTTQQPGYLLKHLRGLVGEHVHHMRTGKMRAKTLTYNRVCDDVTSTVEAKKADQGFFLATKEDFTFYTSTVKDTHKARLNRRTILLAVAALAIVAVFGVAGKGILWGGDAKGEPAQSAGQSPQETGRHGGSKTVVSSEDFLARHTPRIDGLPWSAPIFDGREPVSQPEVYCISSAAGLDASGEHVQASAHCVTEQGTPVVVPVALARRMSQTGGVYNPYRQPFQQQPQLQQPAPLPVAPVATATAPVQQPASSIDGYAEVAGYGSLFGNRWPTLKPDGIQR